MENFMTENTEQPMNSNPVELKITNNTGTTEPDESTAPIEPPTIPETARGDAFVQSFIARTMTLAQHAGIDVVQASDPSHPQNAIYRELVSSALAMAASST
jgi:hypothetical protein